MRTQVTAFLIGLLGATLLTISEGTARGQTTAQDQRCMEKVSKDLQ